MELKTIDITLKCKRTTVFKLGKLQVSSQIKVGGFNFVIISSRGRAWKVANQK